MVIRAGIGAGGVGSTRWQGRDQAAASRGQALPRLQLGTRLALHCFQPAAHLDDLAGGAAIVLCEAEHLGLR